MVFLTNFQPLFNIYIWTKSRARKHPPGGGTLHPNTFGRLCKCNRAPDSRIFIRFWLIARDAHSAQQRRESKSILVDYCGILEELHFQAKCDICCTVLEITGLEYRFCFSKSNETNNTSRDKRTFLPNSRSIHCKPISEILRNRSHRRQYLTTDARSAFPDCKRNLRNKRYNPAILAILATG